MSGALTSQELINLIADHAAKLEQLIDALDPAIDHMCVSMVVEPAIFVPGMQGVTKKIYITRPHRAAAIATKIKRSSHDATQ